MKADPKKVLRLLKTARGQIDGIIKMIDEDQYCMDVANQILAGQAVLRKAVREILYAHMASCVSEAFETGDRKMQDEKINEVMSVFDKL